MTFTNAIIPIQVVFFVAKKVISYHVKFFDKYLIK